jgi:hypothetical protein
MDSRAACAAVSVCRMVAAAVQILQLQYIKTAPQAFIPNRPTRRRTRERLRALPLVAAVGRPQLHAVVVRAAGEKLPARVPRHVLDVCG